MYFSHILCGKTNKVLKLKDGSKWFLECFTTKSENYDMHLNLLNAVAPPMTHHI